MQKNILITGCSSGIGLCCAQGLKARGHRVFATARKMEDVAQLESLGLESVLLDLSDSLSIRLAIQAISNKTDGKIDVLFNNASYAQAGAVEDLTRNAIRAQFETNLFGPMELTSYVIKLMRDNGSGRIIQNGSLLGYITMPFRGAYNASKFALEGLSDTLRQELRGSNLQVSIIEPGPIYTKIRENAKENFLNNIDYLNSPHQPRYQKMAQEFFEIDVKKSFYLKPEAVLKKLIHAIESPRPKTRYYVGFPAHLFMVLKRLLPACVLDWVIWKILERE